MKRAVLIVVAAVATAVFPFMAGAQATGGQEESFTFYGLRFGMTPLATKEIFPRQDGSLVKDPGHGMESLELLYDREDLLMEIRATYVRPEDKLEIIGLQRALRQEFVLPVKEQFPDVEVTIDQYGNRAALRVIFLSSGIREKNIQYHKNLYLEQLK